MDTTKSDAAACGSYPEPDCSTLKEIAEKVCKNVPNEYIISLCMGRVGQARKAYSVAGLRRQNAC